VQVHLEEVGVGGLGYHSFNKSYLPLKIHNINFKKFPNMILSLLVRQLIQGTSAKKNVTV
jgi:hypothetical protein